MAHPSIRATAVALAVFASSASLADDTAAAKADVGAQAELKATTGNGVSGTLTLTQEGDGVRIKGTIAGLAPNSTHGFHVHEKGDCSAPDATSAGGHFNPEHHPHGNPASDDRHAGDMPNVVSDGKGMAKVDILDKGVTLRSGDANDIVGKAIIVHQKADDYKSQPSGDAGSRIACGIIK